MKIHCKRVYEAASAGDGYRVLVDRLWPRGIKKSELKPDEWCKDLAPSTALRKDFHADILDFNAFRDAYLQELDAHKEEGRKLTARLKKQPLTLLYAAKDSQQNHAVILAEWLNRL
ncbi:DUF488 domain-containing protein [Yokenella regensburgei]|uniref:DUF488 domain-containing protein n=1 Tax=Yokenella regensburgei TaxID=158877 RepID=UPI003F19145A